MKIPITGLSLMFGALFAVACGGPKEPEHPSDGAMEEAGEEVDKAAEETEEAADEAADDVEDAVD